MVAGKHTANARRRIGRGESSGSYGHIAAARITQLQQIRTDRNATAAAGTAGTVSRISA